jgi:hypothetical protein
LSWFGSSNDEYCVRLPDNKDLVTFLITDFKTLKDITSSQISKIMSSQISEIQNLQTEVNAHVKKYLDSNKYNYTGRCVGSGTKTMFKTEKFPIQMVSFENVAKQVREGLKTAVGDEDVFVKRDEKERLTKSNLKNEENYARFVEQNKQFETQQSVEPSGTGEILGGKFRTRGRRNRRSRNLKRD